MRVLIVGPKPPPMGGMAIQGRLLFTLLRRDGVPAIHLATNPNIGVLQRVPIVRTLVSSVTYFFALLVRILRCKTVHILGASGTYFLLRVVPAITLGRVLRKRVVLNYRGGLAAEFFSRHWWWVGFFVRRSSVVTVPSAYLSRIFATRGINAQIVPNITDSDHFRFRVRETISPRILVNRNFEPIYNVRLAIEAFHVIQREFPEASLTLAGSGTLESELRTQVQELQVRNVTFVGCLNSEAMADLYARNDIMVNPTDVDNMPISILEGLACGLVVISTSAGGVPDLVSDGVEALLVPPGDAARLAEAVASVLRDPGLAHSLLSAGRRRAESFEWPSVRPKLLAAYQGE